MSNTILKTAIGRALADARLRARDADGRAISQNTLAQALRVDKSTVGDWERGTGGVPPDDVIAAYAKLVGESYGDITDRASAIARELSIEPASQ